MCVKNRDRLLEPGQGRPLNASRQRLFCVRTAHHSTCQFYRRRDTRRDRHPEGRAKSAAPSSQSVRRPFHDALGSPEAVHHDPLRHFDGRLVESSAESRP